MDRYLEAVEKRLIEFAERADELELHLSLTYNIFLSRATVSMIQNLAHKHKVNLEQYVFEPKMQQVLLTIKSLTPKYLQGVDVLTQAAENSVAEKVDADADKAYNHIINFAKNNEYLDKMSHSDIDNILYIYRAEEPKSIRIFERVKLNCEEGNVVTISEFNNFYYNIMDQFPRLVQICSGSYMQKEDHDSVEISLPDLPIEVLGNIFSNLQLQDIILDS